jgi:hypothetical protein
MLGLNSWVWSLTSVVMEQPRKLFWAWAMIWKVRILGFLNNLSESYDFDSIELSDDDSEEVDDLQFSNNNLLRNYLGYQRWTQQFLKILGEREHLLSKCDALQVENIFLMNKVKTLKKDWLKPTIFSINTQVIIWKKTTWCALTKYELWFCWCFYLTCL